MTRRSCWMAAWLLLAALPALADIRFRTFEDDFDAPKWQEQEVPPPDYPKDETLQEFYVSAGTTNRFFVDGATLNPGIADGVIRYVLVVRTPGGASNVTYEGIRCATRELRLYATGRSDGTWSKARLSEWKRIENKPINRHHAALSRDYLCPAGSMIQTAAEGREAFKLGKHPAAP